jgi:hypothetical protein
MEDISPIICTLKPMPRKQPNRLSPKDVAPHAYQWNRAELEEMRAMIDALLEASQPEPQTKAVPAYNSQSRGTRGGRYFEDKMINGCGPYRYLRFWLSGKRKSVYVGKIE